MYNIKFLEKAYDDFKKLDRSIQKLIKEKLDILAINPQALKNNIKQLKGGYSGLYRLKVRNYRIIYKQDIEQFLILIVKIGHRKEVY